MFMYSYCYVCSVLYILLSLCCSVYCFCVMCTVLLPPGVNPIAVNKYISYHYCYYNYTFARQLCTVFPLQASFTLTMSGDFCRLLVPRSSPSMIWNTLPPIYSTLPKGYPLSYRPKAAEYRRTFSIHWQTYTAQHLTQLVRNAVHLVGQSDSQLSFSVSIQPHSFMHSVFCLTTGPKPPPKRCLHIVRSRASSFK